jgi:geranylgeranyl diphosphate synthase type I
MALETASPAQQDLVRRHLGDPDLDAAGVEALRDVLLDTGAVDRVERMIDERLEQALAALDTAPLAPEATEVLRELATAATARAH